MYHKDALAKSQPESSVAQVNNHYMTPFPNMHSLLFRLDDLLFSDHVYRKCPDAPTR